MFDLKKRELQTKAARVSGLSDLLAVIDEFDVESETEKAERPDLPYSTLPKRKHDRWVGPSAE